MKIILIALCLLIAVLLAGMVAVRALGDDPARWHVPVKEGVDRNGTGDAVRVIAGDADRLARIDAVFRELPRTRVLAGSLETGHITYVTRSRWWGFPDYTSVELVDGSIRMHARLRLGVSDLGVNRARLEHVLARLQ